MLHFVVSLPYIHKDEDFRDAGRLIPAETPSPVHTISEPRRIFFGARVLVHLARRWVVMIVSRWGRCRPGSVHTQHARVQRR